MQELSRDALEAIVDSIPAGVIVIEKEKGRTIYANKHATLLFGIDPVGLELPEHSTKLMRLLTLNGDVYRPEQLPASLALLTGENAHAEVVIERCDGSRVITEGSAKPIRDDKGEVIAAIAIFEDITDRKKAEEALRVSEEKFSKAFEGSPFAVTLTRLSDGAIVDVNEAALKLFGFARSEIIGKTTLDLKTWANINDRHVLGKELFSKGSFHNREVALLKKDGTSFDVVMSGAIVLINSEKYWIASFIDITERKKMEATCKESEERFRSLVESTSDWIWQVDQNGVYTYVSPKVKEILGYDPQEVLGKTPFDLMPKEEAKKIAEKFENIAKNKARFFGMENSNIDKNGKLIFLETSGVPILNHDGDLIGYRGIDRDITERKKTEQALKESEQLYRTLFDNSEDGFMLLEPIFSDSGKACDFRFLKLNSAYEHQTGAKAADVLGKKASEVVPDLEPGIISLSGVVAKTGRATHSETYDEYSNKWYDSYFIPFAKGEVGILFRDTTDRKKAENAQLESEEKYRALVEATNTGYLILDMGGKVVEANQEYVRLSGYHELGEIIGRSVIEWTAYYEKQKNADAIKRCMRDGFIKDFVIDYVDMNGLITPVEINGAVIGAGETTRIVSLCRDITERKNMEKQLQDNERMAAIGQTAGMVGHDIRNPLQAVLSDTFLLKDELASMPESQNKEGVAESIDSIERNVAYINKIVQDLQDYARQVVPEYSIVDLSDVFVRVFETIGVPKSIDLSVNVKDAEKIRIDPSLLQRAITNLVNNAIQAMPKGGKLKLRGERIDNGIVVTVSDTGVGIPDEVKPKLFTPMMTTKSKGQGFGLAASKRMIEAMKGTISFESEKGKGTKFMIELPNNQ